VALWTAATCAAALAITIIDALLLHRKRSFFTGGFLAATHANGLAEAAGFLLASLIVDLGVAGLLAAIILWGTSRLRLHSWARFALLTLGALTPLLLWDFISYSLLDYLGDAFDLGLMFDLTGRSTGEVFAVASSHLATPAVLVTAAVAGVVGVVWTLNKVARGLRGPVSPGSRVVLLGSAAFIVGLATSTGASVTSDLAEDGLRRKASGQLFMWLIAELTDVDRDGYGIGGRNRDPAP
jgi:hypothetical protein